MRTAMLHGLSDAVVTVDAEGRVKSFNAEAERLLRVEERAAIGRPIAELLALRDPQALLGAWIGEPSSVDLLVRLGDGAAAQLHASAARAADGALVIVLRNPQEAPPSAR